MIKAVEKSIFSRTLTTKISPQSCPKFVKTFASQRTLCVPPATVRKWRFRSHRCAQKRSGELFNVLKLQKRLKCAL
jgi:hypothetical protein